MRPIARLALGLILVSLAAFSTVATFAFTEDTIYLQCENTDRKGDMRFVAVTPPTKEASVFLETSGAWAGSHPLTVTSSHYMFDVGKDRSWTLMLDRVSLRLDELIKMPSHSFSNSSRCLIVEQGAAEKFAENNPRPKPKI